MLYSFDIFDTLIARKVGEPRGIFAVMQHRLQTDPAYAHIDLGLRENFAVIRERAIELATREYRRGTVEEVTLEQIYEAVRLTGTVSPEELRMLMDLERTVELDNAVPISENIAQVKRLVKQGERVVLISDMYLDVGTVRRMLVKCDDVFCDIPIYLSSELKLLKGLRKSQSSLYRYVLDCEESRGDAWVHMGDDVEQDFLHALWAGGRPNHYIPYEQSPLFRGILGKHPDDITAQYATGVAQYVCRDNHFDAPGRAGCAFSGYVLYAYVHWMLLDCIKRGIKRLYFVARDGNILREIARIIAEEYHIEIELGYVHGSRRAWRMASFSGNGEELREIITLSSLNEVFTVGQYAHILHLTKEELCGWFPEFQTLEDVSILTFHKMTEIVCQNRGFLSFLAERNKENRQLLKEYLKNTLNTSDTRFAFADVNGSGNSQICVARVLADFYDGSVETYFYKMDRMYQAPRVSFRCFSAGSADLDMILEPMTRSMEEQTVGYTRDSDGRVIPCQRGTEAQRLREYGYAEYEAGVLAFAKEFSKTVRAYSLPVPRGLADSYMKELMNQPESDEFLFFANMPFNNTGRAGEMSVFAPRLERRELKELLLYGDERNPSRIYRGVSLEMSMRRRSVEEERLSGEYYVMDYPSRIKRIQSAGRKDCALPYPANERIPFELLGRKIILYGAGNYGKWLYGQLKAERKEIVAWFDSNSEKYKSEFPQITGDFSIFARKEFDCVIVAILDLYWAGQVCDHLLEAGVAQEKIYCPALEV